MTEKKKTYVSPTIESERVDLPEAWACAIYTAGDKTGTWEGPVYGLQHSATYICP